jgi:signal peptidase I
MGWGFRPGTNQELPRASSSRTALLRSVRETVFLVVLALVLSQAVKAYAVQPFVVPSGSMLPTIQLWDRVLVEKVTYRLVRGPEVGDIVVFDNPDPTNKREKIYIKRVIAVAGQTVDVRDRIVWVDGVAISEPYTHGVSTEPGSLSLPSTVPEGYVWLMGDNRPGSGDSRLFGPQPISRVRGRAVWTYWPPARFGELD